MFVVGNCSQPIGSIQLCSEGDVVRGCAFSHEKPILGHLFQTMSSINQNIRSDITNIYHLELIQLSQRPFVGQSVATKVGAAAAAIAYGTLPTRVLSAMFKQPFRRIVGPPSKCHSAPNGCTTLTFPKFHSIFFRHATYSSPSLRTILHDCECFIFFLLSFRLRNFSHAAGFILLLLSGAHCHLHLRFTHAKNNKIYLFPLPLTHYTSCLVLISDTKPLPLPTRCD